MRVEVFRMEIWDKAKGVGSAALDRAREVTDHITGSAALRETEKFHQDMEAVYAALVSRVVSGEQKIEQLQQGSKQTLGIAIASILLSVVTLLVVLFR
jgi:hypothetical protein